jgi:superfamily I DNA and/or RNA helicase
LVILNEFKKKFFINFFFSEPYFNTPELRQNKDILINGRYEFVNNHEYARSILFRLATQLKFRSIKMTIQRRMPSEIFEIANKMFYNGCVETIYHDANNIFSISYQEQKFSRVFINVRGTEIVSSFEDEYCGIRSYYNPDEANAIMKTLQKIKTIFPGVHDDDVAVLTFYTRQVLEIKSCLKNFQKFENIAVRSVDSFQGQEKPIIILSMVRTSKMGFLEDPKRLNVALTRAKNLLIIIGDHYKLKASNTSIINTLASVFTNSSQVFDVAKFQEI